MGSQRELPSWVVPVAIAACVIVLGLIGWRVLGGSGEVGPAKEVHAGMYDIQKEIQKSREAKGAQGGAQSQ